LNPTNLDRQAQHYLTELHLDHKVKVRGGRLFNSGPFARPAQTPRTVDRLSRRPSVSIFSTNGRPIQDPQFKDIFYRQILPT